MLHSFSWAKKLSFPQMIDTMDNIGKIIVGLGLLLVIMGGLMWMFGNIFGWFGNLPGDIRIRRENFQLFFPLTSMILLSLFISLVLWLVRRFF